MKKAAEMYVKKHVPLEKQQLVREIIEEGLDLMEVHRQEDPNPFLDEIQRLITRVEGIVGPTPLLELKQGLLLCRDHPYVSREKLKGRPFAVGASALSSG